MSRPPGPHGLSKWPQPLIYARIADRIVADDSQAVTDQVDALYGQPSELPAHYETTGMAKLHRDAIARMLGNGVCTRPVELDCRMEYACESCTYFKTGPEFAPILTRQRDQPTTTARPTASPSSTSSSAEPNLRLDTDHPCNA